MTESIWCAKVPLCSQTHCSMQTLWEHFEVFLQCLSCCTGARSTLFLPEISSRTSYDYFNINKSLPNTFWYITIIKENIMTKLPACPTLIFHHEPPVQIWRETGWTALRHKTGGGRCSSRANGDKDLRASGDSRR